MYLLKINNRNTRTRCEICPKLTRKTPERRQWRRSGVSIVNFEYFTPCSNVSTVNFEHIITGWDSAQPTKFTLYLTKIFKSFCRSKFYEFLNFFKFSYALYHLFGSLNSSSCKSTAYLLDHIPPPLWVKHTLHRLILPHGYKYTMIIL